MNRTFFTLLLLNLHHPFSHANVLNNWHQWRGPSATGEAPKAKPPTSWSEQDNIKWKAPIPGMGHSTPIVWEDSIILTSTSPTGPKLPPPPPQPPGAHNNIDAHRKHHFSVISIDRNTGTIRWQTNVRTARPIGSTHETGTWASASPITDGKNIFAYFGSNGLYCLSFEGKVLWERQLGPFTMKHGHGEGASPALHNQTLVVNCDHEGQSFVTAINTQNGKEIWRKNREEPTSWATPIIAYPDTHPQAIILGTKAIRSYDLKTGSVLWSCRGLSHNVVASPIHADDTLLAGSSYDTRAIIAISTKNAKGDLTHTDHVLWRSNLRPPYVPSPLLANNTLYYLRHYQNILTQRHAKTGESTHPTVRLSGLLNIYASPVAANGNLYITDQQGTTLVLDQKTTTPKATNDLEEPINSSLAIAGNQLFIRGSKHLYCIEDMPNRTSK